MKITSVEMHPSGSPSSFVLSFRDPRRTNPYNVKAFHGLDADELVSQFYGVPGDPEQRFYNIALTKREPIALIELQPRYHLGETPSSLRDDLYRMISSSRTGMVELRFKDGADIRATISGYVSKFEAALSSESPEVQITFNCEADPMLRAPTETYVDLDFLSPADTVVTDDISTAPHGLRFALRTMVDRDSIIISDPSDVWHFEVIPDGGFLADDVLHLSSQHNNKYIYMVRSAVTTHLADKVTLGAVWPLMFPGETEIVIDEPDDLMWNSISYFHTFWGV